MTDFQAIGAIVFIVALAIFLYLKRKNLETKQIIPYFFYFSMYKTKLGIKLMDSLAKKFRKITLYLGYLGIVAGFLGMAFISWSLLQNIYVLFTKPGAAPGVGLVLPFKAKGVFYVPFFYWIISIFIIAVVHEFAHGLIARANKIKVKSSGFAFLALIVPIIPAAFVEPDEKEMRKRPHVQQLSIFAAGPFSNILFGFLFLALLSLVIAPIASAMIEPNGVKINDFVKGNFSFPGEKAGMKIGEVIQNIDGIETPYVENLSAVMKTKKPFDVVKIKTDKSEYGIKLEKNPENESLAYMGLLLEQSTRIKPAIKSSYGNLIPNFIIWLVGLFFILFVLNLGIGLFNLVPIGPLDGGRMMQIALHGIFGEEKGNKAWHYIGIFFLLLIFVNLVAGFVR